MANRQPASPHPDWKPDPSGQIAELLFHRCFFARYRTVLQGGGSEPQYLPATSGHPCHRIIYRADYFASALHEIAHWCLAGAQRRTLPDYGYWYLPDDRSPDQQAEFERVEVKPQALEWLFADAAGHSFQISMDNLGGVVGDASGFKRAVAAQADAWRCGGLRGRAAHFAAALARHFGGVAPVSAPRKPFAAHQPAM